MRFITSVWHPNISSENGAICLDILRDKWTAALTLNTALLSLQALLSAPEPRDPQDAVVAHQYLSEYEAFVHTARFWTEVFAKGADLGIEQKKEKKKLADMGFPVDIVKTILENCGFDENVALEKLCSG